MFPKAIQSSGQSFKVTFIITSKASIDKDPLFGLFKVSLTKQKLTPKAA